VKFTNPKTKKNKVSLVLQIPCEKVLKHPKPTPKPLAEGIGA